MIDKTRGGHHMGRSACIKLLVFDIQLCSVSVEREKNKLVKFNFTQHHFFLLIFTQIRKCSQILPWSLHFWFLFYKECGNYLIPRLVMLRAYNTVIICRPPFIIRQGKNSSHLWSQQLKYYIIPHSFMRTNKKKCWVAKTCTIIHCPLISPFTTRKKKPNSRECRN